MIEVLNNPLVSICIPAYNAAPFIAETITCWQNQGYDNLEIIIQDDCSTDKTYQISLELSKTDERIRVFKNDINLGIGENWNECYDKAKGEYIIIANADDIYNQYFIKNGLEIFKKYPLADSLSFCYEIFDDVNLATHNVPYHENLKVGFQNNLFELSFFHNPFHIIFSIFRKSSLKKILFENKLFLETQVCDAELFFRIGKNNFNHYYSDYKAGKYRRHPNNNSLKPSGESHSWLFDVFPLYKDYLRRSFKAETLQMLRKKIVQEIKYSLKNKRKFELKSILGLMLNYLSMI